MLFLDVFRVESVFSNSSAVPYKKEVEPVRQRTSKEHIKYETLVDFRILAMS